jgi:23S rRNA (cytidine1920-2'-O)/16S rRNA (cytidine1409-2'-O)-methyltransferase
MTDTFFIRLLELERPITQAQQVRPKQRQDSNGSGVPHRPPMDPSVIPSTRMARSGLNRIRLDRLLVERGLAQSREKAQALILAGQVLVDEQKAEKCGAAVSARATLRIRGESCKYVSRAGLKLEGALDHFRIQAECKLCLDVGASAGGFTDCLLQRGATRVFAVDVGTNQLDWKLRHDPRVVVLEKTNARYLTLHQIGVVVALAAMDVSFISSTLILPALPSLLERGADLLVLVKPQFEVGRKQVGKGGIVRDWRLHQEAVTRVCHKLLELGFSQLASAESILPGVSGNREYFLHAIWPQSR